MVFDPKVNRNSKDGIGDPADVAAVNSTDANTIVALLKGLFQTLGVTGITVNGGATAAKQDTGNTTLTTIDGHVDGLETLATTLNSQTGIVTETAPASDTASSGLNGRLQRIAQRLTSLIALVPASLGAKTAAASFAVTTATDDAVISLHGAVTETAPASDTASSGQNGRLQRIAQRITSLIALLPASLGAKAATASLAVTLATDDAAVTTLGAKTDAKSTATDTTSASLVSVLKQISASNQHRAGVDKATYRAVASAIVQTANGVLVSVQGSGTKTVRITRIIFVGAITTFATVTLAIYRTTGAVSGAAGTSAITPVKHASASSSATAAVNSYTSSTLGAGSGLIEAMLVSVAPSTSGGFPYVTDFGNRNSQGIVLSGTGEFCQISVTAGSFTGASFNVTVEFTEE